MEGEPWAESRSWVRPRRLWPLVWSCQSRVAVPGWHTRADRHRRAPCRACVRPRGRVGAQCRTLECRVGAANLDGTDIETTEVGNEKLEK